MYSVCAEKTTCYNSADAAGASATCNGNRDACLACTSAATPYCATETNRAANLSLLYCVTASVPLSAVSGTATRPPSGAVSGLGYGSLVMNSLSSPTVLPTMPASTGSLPTTTSSSSQGLSGGDIAGITIGTVAVVSLIVLGVMFFIMRKRKAGGVEAGQAAMEAQAASAHAPAAGAAMEPGSEAAPAAEACGEYEYRHGAVPVELDGTALEGGRKADHAVDHAADHAEGDRRGQESMILDDPTLHDNTTSVDHGQNKS